MPRSQARDQIRNKLIGANCYNVWVHVDALPDYKLTNARNDGTLQLSLTTDNEIHFSKSGFDFVVKFTARFDIPLRAVPGALSWSECTVSVWNIKIYGTNFGGDFLAGIYDVINALTGGNTQKFLEVYASAVSTQSVGPTVQQYLDKATASMLNWIPSGLAVDLGTLSLTFDVWSSSLILVVAGF